MTLRILSSLVLVGGAILITSLTAGGCGYSGSDFCSDYCDCEGCSDADLDDCVDNADDLYKTADDQGCADQADDFLGCLGDEVECREGHIDADGCDYEAEELERCADIHISLGSVVHGGEDETVPAPPK